MKTIRLLLPFTGNVNTLALNYAIQFAEMRQATLVPLALIRVMPGKAVRLELIQQAQDFLEFVRYKARQQRVPIEQARIYTSDAVRSIEAVAGEMNCEAVMLFLSDTADVLLDHAEFRSLMDHAACNAHLVLLPARRAQRYLLHMPLLKRSTGRTTRSQSDVFFDALMQE